MRNDPEQRLHGAAPDDGVGAVSDFFEDLIIGTRLDLGTHTFTSEEIVGFADASTRSPSTSTMQPRPSAISGGSRPRAGIRPPCG